MSITPADILAALDVLAQAQNESDDIDFEVAVELRKACQELGRQSKVTADLLEMEMLRQVEAGAKQVGDVNYMAINDNKFVFDHDAIESEVVAAARDLAVDRETGEIDAGEAARQAAYLMRQIYVSPSTTGKIGAMNEVGMDLGKVRDRQKKGRKLLEVDSRAE